ncbi:MAG: flagellin [Lachnospiraceae bacterium]|nr:flagellin [Lachnospiraceae bacterium]
MRVTSSTYYKQYAQTVQDLHSELNKSMKQVSSGKKFDSAKEDPLSYYGGMKIDSEYTDADTKNTVISDVNNRLYQQESGATSIQTEMRTLNTDILRLANESTSGSTAAVDTMNRDMKQRMQTITEDLNASYENFYVFGGNDMSTIPFSLDVDNEDSPTKFTLNFDHHFPGEEETTTRMSISYELTNDGDLKLTFSGKRTDDTKVNDQGTALTSDQTLDYLKKAMSEEGRMSLGYGNLSNRSTLPDTFTGGLNVLTGISSAGLKSMSDTEAKTLIQDRLAKTPIALTGQAVLAATKFLTAAGGVTGDSVSEAGEAERTNMSSTLKKVIGEWDTSEQHVATSYRELGIKQSVLKDTQTRLDLIKDTLQSNYDDRMGIDPYEAITKMYSQQYAYNAAIKVGSNIMQSSLFDYVK